MGVLKVTCLGCCLFNVVSASSVVAATSVMYLNSRIPRWSDVAYESRIGSYIDSLKM